MPPVKLTPQLQNCLSAFLLRLTPENAMSLEAIPEFAMQGAMSYMRNQCGQCHTVNGAGTAVGPPLNGVGERHPKEWLIGHFKDPQKYVPDSIMPPYDLPADEMEALVQFLTALPPQ